MTPPVDGSRDLTHATFTFTLPICCADDEHKTASSLVSSAMRWHRSVKKWQTLFTLDRARNGRQKKLKSTVNNCVATNVFSENGCTICSSYRYSLTITVEMTRSDKCVIATFKTRTKQSKCDRLQQTVDKNL